MIMKVRVVRRFAKTAPAAACMDTERQGCTSHPQLTDDLVWSVIQAMQLTDSTNASQQQFIDMLEYGKGNHCEKCIAIACYNLKHADTCSQCMCIQLKTILF